MKVRGVNLYPQVGNSAPMGTHRYITTTNRAARAHKMVSGTVTLRSEISIRPREALPVRVAAVLASR